MKKLLLLLTALLTLGVSGAWAQVTSITDGGSYVIRFNKNSNFVSPSMNTTRVSAGRFRFDKVGTEGSYDVYNIYSVNGSGYLNRTAVPANEGTTTITSSLEDTDNFKWTVATTVNDQNSDASIWTISPYGYATSGTKFVLTGWTDNFKESNVLKFYSGTSHDLAQLKIAKYADALNELSATACYNITNPRGWWDVASGASLINSTVETSLSFSYSDAKQQFAFIQHDSKYYLYSVSEGKFAYVDGTKLSLTQYFTSDVASSNVTLEASSYSNNAQYPVVVTVGGQNYGISTGYSPDVYAYTSTNDEGNGSLIVEAGSFDYTDAQAQITNTVSNDITYNVMLNGSQVASTTVAGYHFSTDAPTLPASAASNGYCTYKYYSDAACTIEITEVGTYATIYAKVEEVTGLPFTFANAIDDADATWYTLKLRDSYAYNNSGAFGINASEVVSNDGQWVFTGNVYAAQVYNKGAGKYLVWSGSAVVFSETATTSWIIKPHSAGGGFVLYEPANYYFPFVNSSGNVAYSNSGSGNYSESGNSAKFVPIEVEDDFHESIVANVQPYFTTGVGSYFGLKSSVYDDYNARVTTAATSCNSDEYAALLAVVNNAANYVFPETGYYRIQNYGGGYFGQITSGMVCNLTNTDAASIVYLTRSGEEGSYTYTIQLQGATYTDQTGTFTLSVAAPGYFYMNDRTTNTVFGYICKNGTGLSANSIANVTTNAQWVLEAATTFTGTLTDAKDNTSTVHSYATLCVPFAISELTGASAYAPSISGSMLNMGDGASTVAAGTPVILIGASGAVSYTATINTGSAPVTTVATTNDLSGTFTGTTLNCTEATGTTYVLGFDATNDNRIGFYHVTNGSEFALSANRAYLSIAGGGDVKGFAINFDTENGISQIENSKSSNSKCYDLSGRRVNAATKGLYIVNGKKVVIK